uniref:hypothetical protein n=1 Tax=Flavobacterium sp. TaxID=239 RepID=UPI00404A211E
MKKLLVLTFMLMVTFSLSGMHKDRNYYRTYGNIKTYVKTPYENYSAITDVEIIGKLAQKLAEGLSYKDTILLEFSYNYKQNFQPLILVEKANIDYFRTIHVDYWIDNYKKIQRSKDYKKNLVLSVKQINNKFDIWNTLKILEYCLQNEINDDIVLSKYENQNYGKTITSEYYGLDPLIIEEIIKNEKSNLLEALSREKIYFFSDLGIKGYHFNEIYFFSTSNFTYQTDAFFFLVKLKKGICVFNTNTTFIYINELTETEKFHTLDSIGNTPFVAITDYNWYEKKELEVGAVILTRIKAWHSTKGFLFSEVENKLGRTMD